MLVGKGKGKARGWWLGLALALSGQLKGGSRVGYVGFMEWVNGDLVVMGGCFYGTKYDRGR